MEEREGLDITLDILADVDAMERLSESLMALGRGDEGVDLDTVRADLARRTVDARAGEDVA